MAKAGDNKDVKIPVKDLKAYFKKQKDLKTQASEAAGAAGSAADQFIQNTGGNKAAISDLTKIANKSESARADYLRTFMVNFQALYDEVWGPEMHDMLDDIGDGEEQSGEAA